jgi:hypothetical protein
MMDQDPATGRFLPGNRAWEARSSAGPKPKFETPEKLWAACVEYFEWVESTPLWEDKVMNVGGVAEHVPVAKMRAMTIGGLCLFIDVTRQAWADWKAARPDLVAVIARAEEVIYQQKFSGAAADLLNANIIARELGLAEKSELSGPNGGAIEMKDASPVDRIRSRIAGIAARNGEGGSPGGADGK